MAQTTPGRQIAAVLKQEGVDTVFTLSGGHILGIYDGCLREGIRILDFRHEQAAVHAAEGHALVTGRPGVAIVTAGPGVTNAVTGIANAFMSGSPVLLLAGHSPVAQFDMVPLQDLDQLDLMRPITRWARSVYLPERAAEYAAMAFRHMLDGEPGPVFLEVPIDVLNRPVDDERVRWPEGYRPHARPEGDAEQVSRAIDLLLGAERPVIVAGTGVWWSQAHEELQRFVEQSKIPVFTHLHGRGTVPDDHDLCFGPRPPLATLDADVVLAIGVHFDFTLGYGRFGRETKVIQVDISGQRIGLNRPVDVAIVGDPKAVLRQLMSGFPNRSELAWTDALREIIAARREQDEALARSDAVPIHPLRLAREVRDLVDRDATLITDGGDISGFGNRMFRSYQPGHNLTMATPLGCLGVGIPFALAAQAARPGKQVVVLNGDGTFGLNAMEFDTAVRHRLPILSVIGNDQGWGMIRHDWRRALGEGETAAVELGLRRYDQMVEALGGHGEYVERPEDIRPALKRALASGKPACVNVIVDPNPAGLRPAS